MKYKITTETIFEATSEPNAIDAAITAHTRVGDLEFKNVTKKQTDTILEKEAWSTVTKW